jgi:hypothetical protein
MIFVFVLSTILGVHNVVTTASNRTSPLLPHQLTTDFLAAYNAGVLAYSIRPYGHCYCSCSVGSYSLAGR